MIIPKLVLVPIIGAFLTQLVKFILYAIRGERRWSAFLEYGGMPSAHTAFVVSLTTVVGIHEGWHSASFAIAVVFSILIIRDAIGLRQVLGQHSRMLNALVKQTQNQADQSISPYVAERLGHTPFQAFVGGVIGLLVAFVAYATWL